MKTNKAIASRVRLTKNGKILTRKSGIVHFNSKQTGQQKINKRKKVKLEVSKKVNQRFITNLKRLNK